MTRSEELNPEQVHWDAIVVGTGMGGGTFGYSLARAGRRVLFVEKGLSTLQQGPELIIGRAPETLCDMAACPEESYRKQLLLGGRNPDFFEDATGTRHASFIPELGCGTGGSSALYGMVLERFFASDFAPRSAFPDAGESTVPEAWPITYDKMRRWYIEAEKLYRVRGSADPMRPDDEHDHLLHPGPMTPANREFFEFFSSRGLHPYPLHVGCEYVEDCGCCQAFLCPRGCKNHAGNNCVAPAISRYGASLLTECATVAVRASRTRVDGVVCNWKGKTITLRGRVVVLAAGAMVTPSILLNSVSPEWPSGVGNRSGMVGRNLMRHLVDLYVAAPQYGEVIKGQIKEIALSDFYQRNGHKYGTLESFGELPPITHVLNRPNPGIPRKLLRLGRPVLSPIWDRFRSRRLALAGIMEDLPYLENRVLPPGGNGSLQVRFEYTVRENEQKRLAGFRSAVLDALRPYRVTMLKGAGMNSALAHACGTCRFGLDSKTSVLDSWNRAHDFENLYVCDASFFPSSSGTNPALTIAANALRVAAHVAKVL